MRNLKCSLHFLISIVVFQGCKPVKTQDIDVTELTISKIHAAYKAGNFTSEQLVVAYLDRIHQLDQQINSITKINPNALSIAKELDEEYKRTKELRPLHGIPIIVKDNINTKGLPTTAGSLALREFIPDTDAFIIEKLLEAGAIILAKSNMAEWAFSPRNTFNSVHGTTLNPYNLAYTTAGSSGGTAASVAANFGAIGLGTDTGNSIRGPSSHCSLVGFRTTLGLISRAGIIPLNLNNDVVGPICRTVEDATKVLDIMIGYDPSDSLTKKSKGKIPGSYLPFLQKNGLTGARIGVLRELSDSKTDPEIKVLFEQALRDMKSLGAEIIVPFSIPDFSNLSKGLWCPTFKADIESYLATYVKNDTLKTTDDIIRIGTKSKFVADRLTTFDAAENMCLDVYTDPRRTAFRRAIEDQMDRLKLDVIVYPTWTNKPAEIISADQDYKGDNSQVIAPHTGQPAFTVPMGFSKGNLPAGLQFLGRMYSEPTLIKLAYSYEQGTKKRVSPLVQK